MNVNGKLIQTFQGEGPSLGLPAIFLRLYGCNLACSWCDTPYTWNTFEHKAKHPEKHKKEDECRKVSVAELLEELKTFTVKNLVITGGEPMLQQRELTELLVILKDRGWRAEIETNGTIVPTELFLRLINQINCSPKLVNSGPDNHQYKRIVPEALKKFASSTKTILKFVVRGFEDMNEILSIKRSYDIPPSFIYLMPEGRTRVEQLSRQEEVRRLCQKYGFCFTPRAHILMYDDERGV